MKFVIIIIPLLFILFYNDFVSYIMAQEPKISKDYLNYSFEPFLSINGPYYLDILNEKKENLTLGSFSVATWFRITSNHTAPGYIISKGGMDIDKEGMNLNYGIWINEENKVAGGFETEIGEDFIVQSLERLNDRNWHYVILMYNGTVLRLDIDGKLSSSKPTNGEIPDLTGLQPLRIGANSINENKFFYGDVDELRIWKRGLNNSDLNQIYNNSIFTNQDSVIYLNFGGNETIRNDSIEACIICPNVNATKEKIDTDEDSTITFWNLPLTLITSNTTVKIDIPNTSHNNGTSTHNNSTSNKFIYSQNNNTNLTITMRTDKSKYYNDENIMILGNVYDNNLKLTNTVLSVTPIFNETSVLPSFLPSFLPIFLPFLSSSHETKQPLILQKTEIPVIDGIYNFTLYLNKQGFYNISIADKGGNNERFLIVEAKNKFSSYTFLLIYFTIGLLILYCIITWFAVSNEPKIASKLFKYEIYRFFILSSISLIPLISFFVMDVEIGKFSPIGLVMKNIENATDVQQDIISKEWVINIGGSVSDNYSKGITIPFYVFAFGWMGGYLRYLYRVVIKIPFLLDHPDELNTALWLYLRNLRNGRYKDRRYKDLNPLPLFIYASFEELAEILLAPLLAIAVWFLLNIFDPTLDIFTVSLVSFTVGLITRDVVKRLVDYSMKTIGGSANETSSSRSNNEPTEYIK